MTALRRLLPWAAMGIPAWWILRESTGAMQVDLTVFMILLAAASVPARQGFPAGLLLLLLAAASIALPYHALPSTLLGFPAGDRGYRAEDIALAFIAGIFAYLLSTGAPWARGIPPVLMILLAATMAFSHGAVAGPADTVLAGILALALLLHLACASRNEQDARLLPPPHPALREVRLSAWFILLLTLAVLGMPDGRSRNPGDSGIYSQDLHAVTGFSDALDLSRMGLLKSSDARSLIARFSTDGKRWTEDDFWTHRHFPILMRGFTFGEYKDGRFVPLRERAFRFPAERGIGNRDGWVRFDQELFMAPHGSVHLFAQGEVVSASEGVLLSGGLLKAKSIPESPFGYRATSYALPEAARPSLRTEAVRHPDERYRARLPLSRRMRLEAATLQKLLTGTTPLATVEKLEAWFRHDGGFRYTRLNENDPQNPIESFLLDTKAGHCAFFASAMVAVLREWGLPARVAGGLRGGAYSSRMNAVVFLQRDAHAWVEVPFESSGWIAFDPTPGEERLDTLLPGTGEAGTGQGSPAEASERDAGRASAGDLADAPASVHDRSLYPWLAFSVLLLPVLLRWTLRWMPARAARFTQRWSSEGDRLDRWFLTRGAPRAPGRTRRETLSGMTWLKPAEAALALGIIEDYDRLRFSGEEDTPSMRRELRGRIDLLTSRGRMS